MTWDEKAEDYAVAHHTREDQRVMHNEMHYKLFVDGARWQREALLSEEAVERAARGIHASHDRGDWNEERPEVKDAYRDTAIAALTAALGEIKYE